MKNKRMIVQRILSLSVVIMLSFTMQDIVAFAAPADTLQAEEQIQNEEICIHSWDDGQVTTRPKCQGM